MELKSIIPFLEKNKADIKIHFAGGSKDTQAALKAFMAGEFKEWQEDQSKENFNRAYVLSLIMLKSDEWLFAGVYSVTGVKQNRNGRYTYKTAITDVGVELIGRVIVRFKRGFRQSYCCLENHIDQLEVLEVRREIFTKPFPGYDKVNITWLELSTVIDTDPWKTALENQKGVYLIADRSTGNMYVGSATGEKMLWGRWSDYIKNGHGGNKELKGLAFEYIRENFSYSILEVYKANTDDAVILEREQWWKDVLLTRLYGYNKN